LRQNAAAITEFNAFLDLYQNPDDLLAKNVKNILSDLEKGKDLSDYCWVTLGEGSLP
jgi:thioester reductase-like protein